MNKTKHQKPAKVRLSDWLAGKTDLTPKQKMKLFKALSFYARPSTYFAIGFFPDKPCGEFIDDFSKTTDGIKPGKKARRTLTNMFTVLSS